jgi:WD40 repeat protein
MVHVWDIFSGRPIFVSPIIYRPIYSLLTHEGRILAGDEIGRLWAFDLKSRQKVMEENIHQRTIYTLRKILIGGAFYLISSSADSTTKIFSFAPF